MNTSIQHEEQQKSRFLIFTLGKEYFGIGIDDVTEIIGIHAVTEIPEMPDYIKGIINLKGTVIPVMNVRYRFKKQPTEYDSKTCVVVIDVNTLNIGLIVDSVTEVLSIDCADISHLTELDRTYFKGTAKAGHIEILILACENLLSQGELAEVNEIKNRLTR